MSPTLLHTFIDFLAWPVTAECAVEGVYGLHKGVHGLQIGYRVYSIYKQLTAALSAARFYTLHLLLLMYAADIVITLAPTAVELQTTWLVLELVIRPGARLSVLTKVRWWCLRHTPPPR